MTVLRQNVAFDLDGTLFDTLGLVKCVMRDIAGADIIENGRFRIETDPPVDDAIVMEAFRIAFKRVNDIPMIKGADELLKKLYERTGEPPLVITARHHWMANDTYRLMNKLMGGTPYRLLLVNGGHNKVMYLHGIDNFVDDRRRIALQLSHHGKYVFVPKASHNRIEFPVDNVQFIDSVADLIPMINNLTKMDVRYA